MSDGAYIALIGLATVIVAGVPATITAFSTRHLAVQARDHAAAAADAAQKTADTLGEKNGNGPLMAMTAKVLGQNAELFAQNRQIIDWQSAHSAEDDARIGDVLNRLVELSTYTHAGVHELRNILTPIVGKVDLIWNDRQNGEVT